MRAAPSLVCLRSQTVSSLVCCCLHCDTKEDMPAGGRRGQFRECVFAYVPTVNIYEFSYSEVCDFEVRELRGLYDSRYSPKSDVLFHRWVVFQEVLGNKMSVCICVCCSSAPLRACGLVPGHKGLKT